MGIQDIPGYDQQISYLPVFGNDAFAMIIAFFVIVIIAPIVEELFFRGFLLQTLVQYFHPFLGSFITALVFTSIHFQFQSFIPIFVLSLLLNGLFLHTKNIWPSITFHMLNNVLALILEYVVISS
ncbi:CPBP family intramembrane metalloprotease [Candidatus Peregrinibacteria bacterium]|nr:CPBP family intramembrane metalloprotease [Candidatus Peregrinibacteria bacterium]